MNHTDTLTVLSPFKLPIQQYILLEFVMLFYNRWQSIWNQSQHVSPKRHYLLIDKNIFCQWKVTNWLFLFICSWSLQRGAANPRPAPQQNPSKLLCLISDVWPCFGLGSTSHWSVERIRLPLLKESLKAVLRHHSSDYSKSLTWYSSHHSQTFLLLMGEWLRVAGRPLPTV